MYADMGHFGRVPIRLAWFAVALPALVLNYFGQAALLVTDASALDNPFYQLAPDWLHYPLVAFATLATVIASQAIISGVFSLTQQSIQLGFLPRMQIWHTTSHTIGQIYEQGAQERVFFLLRGLNVGPSLESLDISGLVKLDTTKYQIRTSRLKYGQYHRLLR